MKKFLFIVCLFLIGIGNVFASDRIKVKFNACVDGDTAKVVLNNKVIVIRLLAVDTPESVHPSKPVEFYGKESSEYTCKSIMQAIVLEIEYDDNSDKLDKYNRHLVWLFVDDNLFNKSLIENGFGKVAYLYGNYKYTNILQESEIYAKVNKLGIWSTYTIDYELIIITSVIVLLLIIIYKKKIINKQQMKKIFKKLSK